MFSNAVNDPYANNPATAPAANPYASQYLPGSGPQGQAPATNADGSPNPFAGVAPATPGTTVNPGVTTGPTGQGPTTKSGTVVFGGGWDQFAQTPGTPQYALMQGLRQGLSGQQLVDQLNQNPATAGIAYYPDTGAYGLPNGYYVSVGAGGELDLQQRSSSGTATTGPGVGNLPAFPGAPTLPDLTKITQPAPISIPGAPTPITPPNTTTAPPGAGAITTDPTTAALYADYMARANQSENITANDPVVKAQTDAFQTTENNQTRNYLTQLAEQQGSNANIGTQALMANEAAGQATATFQGQAMQQALVQRASEIQNALAGASGLLTTEQSQALQKELADTQNALSVYNTEQQTQTANYNTGVATAEYQGSMQTKLYEDALQAAYESGQLTLQQYQDEIAQIEFQQNLLSNNYYNDQSNQLRAAGL